MSSTEEAREGSLADRLRDRIRREGPMSFRDWMQAALYDERDGYYCRPGPIRQGRAGDYRTAPETSPLFAATFARYFAKLFSELGSPQRWTVIEVGGAAGEFARGVLTCLQESYPDIYRATSYIVDERSAVARAEAASRLSEFADHITFQRISEISKPFDLGIIFSNELIDAFPVHRVMMRNGILRALCVDADESDAFAWVECDLDTGLAEYCEQARLRFAENQIADINLDAEAYIMQAASLIERGFMITVDYGAKRIDLFGHPNRSAGTLRAFRRHRLVNDFLAHPGEQDLTTTIDWTQIVQAGKRAGLKTTRLQRLDQFLLAEELLDELEKLARDLSDSNALRLRASAREMILPHGLAAHFQVLVQRKQS